MGYLRRFELNKFQQTYQLSTFFETGSFKGEGIEYARVSGFPNIISTEIMPEYVELCTTRFKKYPQIEILAGNSFDLIDQHAAKLKGNTFFWLDAHYPGADGGIKGFNDEKTETINFPLEMEIEQICKHKDVKNDVFLLDDLRIYEDGPFQQGNMPPEINPPANRNANFVDRLLGATHVIHRLYNDEGYLLCLPKTVSNQNHFIAPPKKKKWWRELLKKIS